MSVPETEGSNENKFTVMSVQEIEDYCIRNEVYDEAMIDLEFANVSQGEREILATELAKMRWEKQQ